MSRSYCHRCQRPSKSCVCFILDKHLPHGLNTTTQLLIIQHPLEQNHPKGTGLLLHRCLTNSQLLVTETLSTSDTNALLTDKTALLYPASEHEEEPSQLAPNTIKRLVILDGTWRKTRKILHQNARLQQLPRLSLPKALITTHYRIRKAHREGQLATLEAAQHALQHIEPQAHQYQALGAIFTDFVDFKEQEKQQYSTRS